MKVEVPIYISNGAWFDKGSPCLRLQLDDMWEGNGLYWGTRTSQTEAEASVQVKGYPPCWPLGTQYQRSEICDNDDFEFRGNIEIELPEECLKQL